MAEVIFQTSKPMNRHIYDFSVVVIFDHELRDDTIHELHGLGDDSPFDVAVWWEKRLPSFALRWFD